MQRIGFPMFVLSKYIEEASTGQGNIYIYIKELYEIPMARIAVRRDLIAR